MQKAISEVKVTGKSMFCLGLVVLLGLGAASPALAAPGGLWLGQWEDMGGEEGASKGGAQGELRYGADLRFETRGRELKCTHAHDDEHHGFLPTQHSQVNQDSEIYASTETLTLAGWVEWTAMDKLTVTGELRIGSSWSTVQYDQGPGNLMSFSTSNVEFNLDTNAGFPYFGLRIAAHYEITDELKAGAGWEFCYATAHFGPTFFGWSLVNGFYSFTEQALFAEVSYETEIATPYAGVALDFHNGWSVMKQRGGGTRKWLLDTRETGPVSIFFGAHREFEGGPFVRIGFSLVGTWAARFTLGYAL
jgi:hypothetical protein